MNRRGFLQSLAALGLATTLPAPARSGIGLPPEGVMVRAYWDNGLFGQVRNVMVFNRALLDAELSQLTKWDDPQSRVGVFVDRTFGPGPVGPMGNSTGFSTVVYSFCYDGGEKGLGFMGPKHITRWEAVDVPQFIGELK